MSPYSPHLLRAFRPLLFGLVATIAFALPAEAAQYIRDVVYVPLRSGPSLQHRILENLRSGAAVEVLSSAEGGYVEVRTADGDQGWLEEQYLTDEPIARDRLEAAQAEAARLRQANRELQAKLEAATADQSTAVAQVAALRTSEQELNEELIRIRELSADSVRLHAENEALATEAQQLRQRTHEVEARNEQLSRRLERDQFMNGAYAVAMGVGLTLIVPRLWPRRRRSEWG